MPLTREQIRSQHQAGVPYVSPHYGDGGWHETPGQPGFDPMQLEPLRDRILVRIFAEKVPYALIIRPETAAAYSPSTRRGIILKVGPGRWIDDEFRPTEVRPGQEVSIGPHHDYQSIDAGWVDSDGSYVVLCQEADIRVIHLQGVTHGETHSRSTQENQAEELRPSGPKVSHRGPGPRTQRAIASVRKRLAGRKK